MGGINLWKYKYGEYVRTKKGEMGKVLKVDGDWIETSLNEGYLIYNQQLKHSKNIIDLVEVGDYINGVKIEEILQVSHKHNSIIINNEEELLEEEIKSIVTYQSFKQVEYEV